MQNSYVIQRDQYRPSNPKAVFVMELPPEPERFFYDPAGKPSEPFFRALMQVLFDKKFATKEEGLRAFQEAGYAIVHPTYAFKERVRVPKKVRTEEDDLDVGPLPVDRTAELMAKYPALREELNVFCNKRHPDTKVILIKADVFRAYAEKLKLQGYPVVNENVIPFPLRHHFKMFRKKVRTALGLAD